MLSNMFWVVLAHQLIEKGYEVYTNTSSYGPNIDGMSVGAKGAVPISLPIDVLLPFIQLPGRVIIGSGCV